ncbi:sigma 54-interacting transcriptional regulator [Nitrosospira multiformis]|uniref:Two component, sigma54 specific, transcriptional regulator, Fis family n=1 Tax=Nitrosospira multiformis (strain ATCC 25196 / NCIMB 11849 / C 71) TaxID=323848 RepID=Q2Y9V7_NITMU|nr:sigma 54-interacting transcriptional regulator [Nitrosospira multiformis]ABB74464.1 two component, sigma54 specific, transcriptional regulator, Fis family [Nitrosospira multiformis ATCC 25196]SEA25498.1 two component, sigma54 specific, transcriptional regulator, Fis family [Nitrosospira multiformis]SEF76805.1 two component, sigma54 specific, transcriptional regulator, Fis family [Nitrosospira multiformis ATCC 25196]
MSDAKPRILIVDDDTDLLELLTMRLTAAGYKVDAVPSAEAALNYLDVSRPQLVISDMQMSGMDGMALFEQIHRSLPTLPVIILTAHGTIPDAVTAVQRGVFGYLAKPFDSKTLLANISQALKFVPGAVSQKELSQAPWRKNIITQSAVMEDLLTRAGLVAEGDASVLIYGESGVGKELFAHAIHDASKRSDHPFVAINCAAIPEQLLESELFGHVKGAFTGAVRDHKGLFQLAEGGTLFLDEIGDMPVLLQVKLLRVLQERQVRPVGSAQSIPVDVRIISATHRDLKTEIAAGTFREDLYYRLDVVSLTIPVLAQRREDIPLLVNYFLSTFSEKYQKNINGFSPEAMETLVAASWPGNVRQLMNVVERCVALSTAPLISPVLVYDAMHREEEQLVSFEDARRSFERDYLVRVLKITGGNVTQAARLAKRNRTEFYKLLQRYQLDPSVFKQAQV